MKKQLTKEEKRELIFLKSIQRGCKFGVVAGVLFLFTIIGIPLGFILIVVCTLIVNHCKKRINELEGDDKK